MRAARLHEFGRPLTVEDTPSAEPGPDEVVVRLTHAGVNPIDLRFRDGGAGKPALPFVPGCDGVGHTSTGPVAVQGAGIGTQRWGTFADEVVAPLSAVVPIPDGVPLRTAAALGVAGMTASHVVRSVAEVTPADRVLVLGATGAVAMLATQIAVAAGATVWAHTSRSSATVDGLGAASVVVTDAAGLREAVRSLRPTVVVDGLGGAFTAAAVRCLSSGGRLVLYGVAAGASAELDLATVYRRGLVVRGVATRELSAEASSGALADCLSLVAGGRVRAVVAEEFSLSSVNVALDRVGGRGHSGKFLISLG